MIKNFGHLLLSGIFISGGWGSFNQPAGPATKVEKAGLPKPELDVTINGAVMALGGILLGLNIIPKFAAATLLASLIPTTIIGHDFWNETDEAARRGQEIQFLKNLGLIGGLLLILTEKDS